MEYYSRYFNKNAFDERGDDYAAAIVGSAAGPAIRPGKAGAREVQDSFLSILKEFENYKPLEEESKADKIDINKDIKESVVIDGGLDITFDDSDIEFD